jgi:D-beta-D-heptose 7-phosphate kinase/D-beta-D-heptose 1-phosphate adenosyltransferase
MSTQLREKMARHSARIWVLGDVMLDRYIIGTVERVSPEAPVPVLLLNERQQRVGGAANVAHNLAALGAEVALGGSIGNDEAGAELRALVEATGVRAEGLVRRDVPTTTKLRALAGAQQLLRVDDERRVPLESADRNAVIAGCANAVPDPAVVLISDYDKGVVSQELIAAVRRTTSAPIFVDPKGRDYSRYVGSALITPNEREAQLASGIDIVDDETLRAAAARLRQVVGGGDVVVTRGAHGMTALVDGDRFLHAPARARRTFDVTGAGDTAIAALALCRAHDLPWDDALHVANVAAGVAVGKVGAVAVYAEELLAALSHEDFNVKLIDRRGLAELRRTVSAVGQRLVFTNGCFDLLHVGHLRLLQTARAMGDLLLVAVNSDASVRRLKGETRPVVNERDRASMLAALESVDFVTIFDEDTPLEAILACRPDVLVKGGDYNTETIVGAREVASWGGAVRTVPLVPGRSTTAIVELLGDRKSPHS